MPNLVTPITVGYFAHAREQCYMYVLHQLSDLIMLVCCCVGSSLAAYEDIPELRMHAVRAGHATPGTMISL